MTSVIIIISFVLYFIIIICVIFYCIVLYIYIYIALLAVHINQKRFQWPREKRREQSWENKKRHLAHQLIKWILHIC